MIDYKCQPRLSRSPFRDIRDIILARRFSCQFVSFSLSVICARSFRITSRQFAIGDCAVQACLFFGAPPCTFMRARCLSMSNLLGSALILGFMHRRELRVQLRDWHFEVSTTLQRVTTTLAKPQPFGLFRSKIDSRAGKR